MLIPNALPEDILHYIWENKLFMEEDLTTVHGDRLAIQDTGTRNSDSGPDFFNARVKIGDTLWIGNVEIHKQSSDWFKHNHQKDKAYDNVILHVVENYDKAVFNTDKTEIPVLILRFPERIKTNYNRLLSSKTWIACEEQFHKIDLFAFRLAYHRFMIERLENKTREIMERLKDNGHNWEETFYQFLARMFGFKVNALPFELLSKSLPLKIISKHRTSLFQLEALLFGNSGLLNEQLLGDAYFLGLRNEYAFLYKKYNLKGMESHLWKFMRLRPVNFPTVRIAQFASLIKQSETLFSNIITRNHLKDIQAFFNVGTSDYWTRHYRFNKSSKPLKKELGLSSVNILILNVVIPFLFVYGDIQGKMSLKNRALDYLESLPPEDNAIIRNWLKQGIHVQCAFDSQALIHLKNVYCDQKKCLNCPVGNKLIGY